MIILIHVIFFTWLYIRFGRRPHGKSIAFFHPYCDAGGGGEKVLWEAANAISENYSDQNIYIFTGDDADQQMIINRAENRFNLKISDKINLVHLRSRWLVEASTWPFFTLAGQSIGSVFLALEAVIKLNPDIIIDSMGYSFTYPLFWICGAKIGCYIHYPTISTDMLEKVRNRANSFNNKGFIAKSKFLTTGKLIYYNIFSLVYGWCGRFSQVIMSNSSWTAGHLDYLWNVNSIKIFPPCDVSRYTQIPIDSNERDRNLLISLAQFRPEKNHEEQVRVFALLKKKHPDLKFIMAGGVRNEGDENRADEIEALAVKLGIEKDVKVERNISFARMDQLFRSAWCAIHTMRDEHFGITCVEFKASGILTVAHESAGPGLDILIPYEGSRTGFLAKNLEEFSECLHMMFSMSKAERLSITENGRLSCKIFSVNNFRSKFVESTRSLFL